MNIRFSSINSKEFNLGNVITGYFINSTNHQTGTSNHLLMSINNYVKE
jgi:hypothetical protein